jgi:hypothetical protein
MQMIGFKLQAIASVVDPSTVAFHVFARRNAGRGAQYRNQFPMTPYFNP